MGCIIEQDILKFAKSVDTKKRMFYFEDYMHHAEKNGECLLIQKLNDLTGRKP